MNARVLRGVGACLRTFVFHFMGMIALSACTIPHDYQWTPYDVAAERVQTTESLFGSGPVAIINDETRTEQVLIGQLGAHQYFASYQHLGEAVATQLADELSKRDVVVQDDAKKTLRITTGNAWVERGMWVVRAHFRCRVEAGNGYVFDKMIGNSTPLTVPRGYNGAVALAVIDLLNDPEIARYLSGSAK